MLRIPILLLLAGTLPLAGTTSAQAREQLPPPNVPKLLRELDMGSPTQRTNAAEELGRNGIPGAIPALIRALRYEDPRVQEAALVALNTIGNTKAAPEIRRFLHSANGPLRMLAAMTLMHFEDEPSIKTVLDFLQTEDLALRRETARLFTFVPLPEAVPALEAALEDRDLQVRLSAVTALGLIRNPSSEAKIAALLESDNEALRTSALMALASTVPENYKEELLEIYRSASPLMRRVVTPLARLRVPEVEQLIMAQTPGAPLLNFYNEPEICEKLRSTRVMIREFRWLNLEQIAALLSKKIGVPVEVSGTLPGDPKEIRLAGNLGVLGYRPEVFAILNSLSPQYWKGVEGLISFIIEDGKVKLVSIPEAMAYFRERYENRKPGKPEDQQAKQEADAPLTAFGESLVRATSHFVARTEAWVRQIGDALPGANPKKVADDR